MPDISKINALAIGSVSKVDGLAKASILDINGIAVTSRNPDAATSGFLFTYSGSAAAYSVRQLNNNAPYVLRVRRVTGTGNTGNDDEADVKFDTTLTDPTISLDSPVDNFSAGGSNATTLGEFLNVGTVGGTTYTDADSLSPNTAEAYVTTWFDLTGNQNHAEQTTPASQPQIHSGTVDTDLITSNGKPALDFDGSNDKMSAGNIQSNNDTSVIFVGARSSASFANNTVSNHTGGTHAIYGASLDQYILYDGSNFYASGSGAVGTSQHLYMHNSNGSTYSFYINSSSIYSGSRTLPTGSTALEIGSFANFNNYAGTMQEIVVWSQDETSNRTGIETDINGFFGIY